MKSFPTHMSIGTSRMVNEAVCAFAGEAGPLGDVAACGALRFAFETGSGDAHLCGWMVVSFGFWRRGTTTTLERDGMSWRVDQLADGLLRYNN